MTKRFNSGRAQMIKGSLLYGWEELKTMNMVKCKALYRIGVGYVKMKLFGPRKPKTRAISEPHYQSGYAQ